MGGDKALKRVGGETLIARCVRAARGLSDEVAVAVRSEAQVAGATDAPLLLDDAALPGPLAGIASALRFARRRRRALVLTLPCDLASVPADLGERLYGALESETGVAAASSGGRLHPVCALWRANRLPEIGPYVRSGRLSVRGFAEVCGMVEVEWPEKPDPFVNLNTPQDLAAVNRPWPKGQAAPKKQGPRPETRALNLDRTRR